MSEVKSWEDWNKLIVQLKATTELRERVKLAAEAHAIAFLNDVTDYDSEAYKAKFRELMQVIKKARE